MDRGEGEALGVGDDALDRVLVALANPHRRDIVHLVGLQPWAVSQLARRRGLSLPAIHKHLAVLVEAGLVTRHKRGRITYVTLDPAPLRGLQDWVGQFHTYWSSSQATYENYARHLDAAAPNAPADPATPPARPPRSQT